MNSQYNLKMSSDYVEATKYMVLKPQNAPFGKKYDEWITASSPKWQRIAVVQLTRYMSLETGYRQDAEVYVETWSKNNTEVFSITECICCKDGRERDALVGILTFHKYNSVPVLYHCYIHPLFRKKGKMTKAWEAVKLKFPQFEVEPPLSPAMERFMKKVDCSHILPST